MRLVLFGGGVVANVLLSRSKGQKGGWIVITAGWACGVTFAVYDVNALNGARLNPAVTSAIASIGKFQCSRVPADILAQTAGGLLGGVLVWLAYLPHCPLTEDKGAKLAVFCTTPAVPRRSANLLSEAIATAALVMKYILALDQGTTRSRAIVFDHGGAVVAIPSLVERT
jgi:glycerol uptake facilitator protein